MIYIKLNRLHNPNMRKSTKLKTMLDLGFTVAVLLEDLFNEMKKKCLLRKKNNSDEKCNKHYSNRWKKNEWSKKRS